MVKKSPKSTATDLLYDFPEGTEIKVFETWRGASEKATIRKIKGVFSITSGVAQSPEWQEIRGRPATVSAKALNDVRSLKVDGRPVVSIYEWQQDFTKRDGFNGFAVLLPRGTRIRSEAVKASLLDRQVLEAMRDLVAQAHLDGQLGSSKKISRWGTLGVSDGRLGIEGRTPSWLKRLHREPQKARRLHSGVEFAGDKAKEREPPEHPMQRTAEAAQRSQNAWLTYMEGRADQRKRPIESRASGNKRQP